MLRIGSQPPATPPQATPPQTGTPDPAVLQQLLAGGGGPLEAGGDPEATDIKPVKIIQQMAGYMGPEAGPFQCQNCTFFQAPNACGVVDGDIDPEGCCNNFTPGGAGGDTGDTADQGPTQQGAPDDGSEPSDQPASGA